MTRHVPVLIIGSGFAGLGLAIKLRRSGFTDFLVVERASDVGGTWRDNHYPGVACDVPSHLYSFSFLPNPDWSHIFSPGREIQDYIRRCAADEGILPYIAFNSEMQECRWNASDERWTVKTSGETYTANIVVTATGHLADSRMPPVPGLEGFAGDYFHSACWNHDVDLKGKRVGVVGSGASAIQIVPEVQKLASRLVVFQRSAPYIVPRPDRAYSPGEKRLFRRDPNAMQEHRSELFWINEYNFAQRRNVKRFLEEARTLALGHLAAQVGDGDLRRKLTPDYLIGCKRVLVSNTYYPAIAASNVLLEPSAFARVEDGRAVAVSGRNFDLDVLIFATGFEAVQPPFAKHVFNARGVSLDAHWERGMQAYGTMAVHGYPNLFILNGPNTGQGHNSALYIIEAQIDYLMQALEQIRSRDIAFIEPHPEAEDAYMSQLDARSSGTIWLAGGCNNWYVDKRSGRLTVNWPDYAHKFRDVHSSFRAEDYAMRRARVEAMDEPVAG